MTSLFISVVTPTLNAERFISECLASVEAQNLATVEHLIVDGGSTDRTEEHVRASRAIWLPRPGLRQSAAINAGLREARGEVVAWLNADDLYTPESLTSVAEAFAGDADLDVLFGDCDVIGESGEFLWRERPGPYDFCRLLWRGNSLAQPAVFLRKRIFEELGYLDESLDYGMDYEYWLRIRGRRIAYVPRVLAEFRWHSASKTSNNQSANWRELLIIVRRYGGGWTPPLVWSFAMARLTVMRQQTANILRRSK